MRHRPSAALAGGLLAIALAGAAAAATPAPKTTVPAAGAAPANRAPAAAGLVIGIDPETGEPGLPTAEQLIRLSGLGTERADLALVPVPRRHGDGRVSLDTRSWMREYAVVRLGADGRPVLGCVEGATEAGRALESAAPALEER